MDELKDQYDFACMERESYKLALESKKRHHDVVSFSLEVSTTVISHIAVCSSGSYS